LFERHIFASLSPSRCYRASQYAEAGRECSVNIIGGVAMADGRGSSGGITLGGVIVIIVLMIVWSFWIGLIIAIIGLVAFGGFARGRWY